MTKGTKIFRIIICVLLAITMLFSAFFAFAFCLYIARDIMEAGYGIYVAGVSVTRNNEDDVLGDGTVYYNANSNILVFNNATIETEETVVYSKVDLNIELIGENKFICTNGESGTGIYAGDYHLRKDLAIMGEGSLTVELPNAKGVAAGISADELTVATDLSVIVPDCDEMANGIVCSSALLIIDNATVTVNNGASKYSAAVRVRGNAFFEEGTALKVSVNPGSTGTCKGFNVSGDLFLGKNTVLEVSIDDGATDLGECIRVSGLMEIGIGSTVTASAKNTYAIECYETIEANEGATISAASDNKAVGVFCSGAVLDGGANFNAEVYALGGIHNQD